MVGVGHETEFPNGRRVYPIGITRDFHDRTFCAHGNQCHISIPHCTNHEIWIGPFDTRDMLTKNKSVNQ